MEADDGEVLYCEDLHDPIEGDSAKPSSMPDKELACVSFPKRTILSSASVGIRAGDVTDSAKPNCIEKPLVVSDNALKLVCFIMYLRRQKLTLFGKN
jgi:hypothetical protein